MTGSRPSQPLSESPSDGEQIANAPTTPLLGADAAHDDRLIQAGRLLTGVVHEIKNPLAVIQGYAQLMHDKCEDEADRADLQSIIDETRRVGALVHDMLSFTRRAPEQAEDVDVSRVVQAAINLTRHVMRQSSVSVVASLPDEAVLTRGQYGAYVQVLLNLLENARQSLDTGRSGGRGRFRTSSLRFARWYPTSRWPSRRIAASPIASTSASFSSSCCTSWPGRATRRR